MSVPTYTQPQQEFYPRTRRSSWLLMGGLSIFALIIFGAFVWLAASSALNTVRQTGSIPERYYLNILNRDYTTAASYLDTHATINGQAMDKQAFMRLAKAADAQYGTVHGITLNTETDATHVTVTVSRGSRNYDVHLVLKQENSTWKIISADGI